MKSVIRSELFGEDTRQICRMYTNIINNHVPGLGSATIGNIPPSAWVAEITGFDDVYKYKREFLKCKKDYSTANSKGSRGVMAEWIVESGHVYEVKRRKSRFFCTFDEEGELVEMTESEVRSWLKNRLESMSSQPQDSE